ncbi:hypothetical protein BESB_066120 [Besnoitia besnoiti]|uniref:tRNA/rRNA methyltransferase SpoU type domain-containing protein n=1 Tax=Besnoitia besnoiti TaxID=94643 RepID=A0A2A9M9K0_BESBE|nr:hypothetical protein BESB_066120 [Besnoitia besnoiti]PFH34579.1 hypothetical protein BESB_066120 [Besnoitia besnoiti]
MPLTRVAPLDTLLRFFGFPVKGRTRSFQRTSSTAAQQALARPERLHFHDSRLNSSGTRPKETWQLLYRRPLRPLDAICRCALLSRLFSSVTPSRGPAGSGAGPRASVGEVSRDKRLNEEAKLRAFAPLASSDGAGSEAPRRTLSDVTASPSAAEHERRLRRRIQASGRRPSEIRRLQDVLVTHLLSVAGNPSYRLSRQSVIVSGVSLINELRKSFHCKRLIVSRHSKRPKPEECADAAEKSDLLKAGASGGRCLGRLSSDENTVQITANCSAETHFASDRIVRKLSGLHSYDGGCVAEMRYPPPAATFGDVKLLLCLGRPPSSFYENSVAGGAAKGPEEECGNDQQSALGTVGTILRSAAALQWQGVWLLPHCPDIFSPLGIRASQGALFWLPYRKGTWDEFLNFAAEQQLLICVPHRSGIDVHSGELLRQGYKGICLLIDDTAFQAAECVVQQRSRNEMNAVGGHTAPLLEVSDRLEGSVGGGKKKLPMLSRHHQLISLPPVGLRGSENERADGVNFMHPVSSTTIMMYQLKHTHFPDTASSAFLFCKNRGS